MSKKLKLTDREWREFYFSDVFTRVQRGKRLKKDDHIEGTTPYVSSTATSNGIDGFVGNKERVRIFSNCISLANSGSVGNAFFQEFEFVASDHVTSLLKEGIDKYAYLFMLPLISRLSEKYSFNREINDLRISRERLMLPIQLDGTPDWAFMEVYMKQVEEELLSEALPKLEQQLLDNIIMLGALEDREWREFALTEFFNPIKGNQNNMSSLIDGKLPLVSAKKGDNGVKTFVSPNKKSLFPQHCITLNLDGDGGAGLAFYQEYSFALDSHVVALYPKLPLNKFSLLFIARSISAQCSRFGHGRAINKSRLNHFLLMLPIQADGTPDWEFMSVFMKKVEQDTLSEALRYFKLKKCDQMLMGGGGKFLIPFYMEDVVTIANGVRLTKADMTESTRPFVGASEEVNGVTEFVGNLNASLDSNVLGVNYNGSVGFSFYHPYEALFSDDVKRVRWKAESANNKYTLLFLSTAIAQQRGKYAYGYKFNAQRMKRQIIMLPSLTDGTPDYAYMEQTMRAMEYDVLITYLKFISV